MFMLLEIIKRCSSKGLYLIVFLIVAGSFSCNVEKNRKILSVFFDGVPEKKNELAVSDKIVSSPGARVARISADPIISQHPDHKTRNCSKCHTRSVASFLKTDRKKICFTCHKPEKFTGKYVHGPVAVKACNTCHDPHQSTYKNLLLAEGRKLCDLCHKLPISGARIPCKEDNCLNCHNPHAADNKFFLRKNEAISPEQN